MVDQKSHDLLDAIEAFYFAYRAFTARPDRILAQRGLGRVHHRLLYFVGRQPGMSVNALRETLGVSKQAMHAPLRQLVDMRLIQAEAASHDRRVKQLALTAAGADLERQLTETQSRQLSEVFEASGTEAAKAWRAVMHQLSGARALPAGNEAGTVRPDRVAGR